MNMQIIDGHFHIWNLKDLPWLQAPVQMKIFGDGYQSLQRDYTIEEYLSDVSGSNVVGAVYVQANWPAADAVREVEWVQSTSKHTGFPQAIVGFVDLSAENREDMIRREMAQPNLRGLRQQVYWHPSNESYRFGGGSKFLKDRYWISGLELLEKNGLLFELQVFPEQMSEAASVVAAFPGLQFVLVHAGMIEDRSERGWTAWRAGMANLANYPNVSVKLSGGGTFVRKLDSKLLGEINKAVITMFGADRCMFGSNFPIEKIWTDYRSLVDAMKASLDSLSEEEQSAVLRKTAARLYRIDV